MIKPWRILHFDLRDPLPAISGEPRYDRTLVIFWWGDLPLGHVELLAAELPIPSFELTTRAARAVVPAIRARLFGDDCPPAGTAPSSGGDGMLATCLRALASLEGPLTAYGEPAAAGLDEGTELDVSVVICTRDRPESLAQCLRSLEKLRTRPLEIIVVDNAPSSPATRDAVSGFDGVTYVREPRPGLSVARNTGIRASRGDIVAFTDDDVVVHPQWLSALYQAFDDPQVVGVTGPLVPAELETEAQVLFEMLRGVLGAGFYPRLFGDAFFQSTKRRGVPVWQIGAGANMAFRREAFQQVGMFDERLGAGAAGCSEDSELWYRLLVEGGSIRYEPAAVVYHYHRRDLEGLRRQMYQYTRGHIVALFVQFARYRHWGNLYRVFAGVPYHYASRVPRVLLRDTPERRRIWLAELAGTIAGLAYILPRRGRRNHPAPLAPELE